MAAKTITFECTKESGETLLAAIRLYADAAYPVGGSECAQVAREALLDVAANIENQLVGGKVIEVSRRLRANIKAALDYYQEVQEGSGTSDRVLQLKTLLSGKP